ncbi:site-2 protease family protein [Streptomyces purpurogeneiscleroticus]|uniref:site-2 protease family protein n=1 Tax=Streptomyces purpurogeneiscleroticus TaxID=68259 RepID=UPI001CBA89C2|nr:site-2 protease family protein [Streptomyces purpurogeneiscleroticus]MBZ4019631.1 site-2 protease family protein [Streptomyces purpurogeneiscleroticus]
MKGALALGRIAGVRIGVHWSVLVILVLVTLALAQGRLPESHPGYSAAAYWGVALATAVVFLASLLAHEVAHAIVARRHHVKVEDITLWMLGGVARLRDEASSPRAELRIAGVGPLTSAVLGGVFVGLFLWLDRLPVPQLLTEAVGWLAAVNILLAVFNSLPAAPLDGGRLLRAFLWRRSGDRLKAALGATAAGRFVGWLLVLLGFVSVLFGGDLSGLWLALIGWFMIVTATAEGQQAQLRSTLSGVPVRQVMTPHPATVSATATVQDFLMHLPTGHYRHTAFPVMASAGMDGIPVGLVSVTQIDRTPADRRATTTLGEVMSPLADVATALPGTPVVELLPLLESGAGRALVLSPTTGNLLGIVSRSDISRTVSWLMAGAAHRP